MESSISELCRREGIAESLYYNWSKDFMEAGKKRLAGDTARQATSSEVTGAIMGRGGSEMGLVTNEPSDCVPETLLHESR